MKKSIILIAFAISAISASAQTAPKHLPKKVIFELTEDQTIAIFNKVDSLRQQLWKTSNAPANVINPLLARFDNAWYLLSSQIEKQLVADTVAVKKKK